MADIDFYGYERSKAGTYLYSSDYAAVYFAGGMGGFGTQAGKAGLVQNATCAYQHNVVPKFEGGSSELFWVTGQAVGRLALGRLLGEEGILNGIGQSSDSMRNGLLGGVDFKVGRLGGAVTAAGRQDVLVLKGCVLSAYGLTFSVNGLEVQENLTIETALVKRSMGSGVGGLLGALKSIGMSALSQAAGAAIGTAANMASAAIGGGVRSL